MEKRERSNVTQACDACRRRKMRCERTMRAGSEPQCKACHNSGFYCTFDLPANRRGPRPKYSHVSSQGTVSRKPHVSPERTNSISTESSTSSALPSIDTVLPPEIFSQIIQDYLDFTYPIHPFVHIPTFKKNLADGLHTIDTTFFCFIISLCAAVSASYPTARDFIKQVHRIVQRNRDPDMHENMTMINWALAYTLFLSHACIGQSNTCRLYKAEATAIVMDMACHRLGTYSTLNPIETQVRKKAFWITVATHICVRITGESWDTLNDRSIFEQADANNLHVLPIDDEYITAEGVGVPPPDELQVAAAFSETLDLIKTMAAITKDPTQPKVTTTAQHVNQFTDMIGSCSCGRLIRTVSPLVVFQDRLEKVRSCLANLPEQIRAGYIASSSLGVRDMQIEILRVNMHIEHLWMQHVLIDRLKLASMTMTEDEGGLGQKQIWKMREEVYTKLLSILEGVNPDSLAPNGHAVVLKIRQIAASLLDFPPDGDDEQMEIARGAQAYLRSLTTALSRLDGSYTHGKVIDMNISKQAHMVPTPNGNGNKVTEKSTPKNEFREQN